eukprot:4442184-Prymnesium_polylepis.1
MLAAPLHLNARCNPKHGISHLNASKMHRLADHVAARHNEGASFAAHGLLNPQPFCGPPQGRARIYALSAAMQMQDEKRIVIRCNGRAPDKDADAGRCRSWPAHL